LTLLATYPDEADRADTRRWALCFAAVLIVHGVGFAAYALWRSSDASQFDSGAPVVLLDLPQITAAPETPPNDMTPGPPEPESDPTPPPKEETKPPEPESEIALPMPEPPKPEPPTESRPPTAMPSVEIPPAPNAPLNAGAAVTTPRQDFLRWQSALAAHIERFKRYPAEARARDERGIVTVAFTIDRDGHVLTSNIVKSSGSPLLDQEVLTMLTRAQPMPRPPADVPTAALSFVVPVRFAIK
jgi:periplasmic protein TonB